MSTRLIAGGADTTPTYKGPRSKQGPWGVSDGCINPCAKGLKESNGALRAVGQDSTVVSITT